MNALILYAEYFWIDDVPALDENFVVEAQTHPNGSQPKPRSLFRQTVPVIGALLVATVLMTACGDNQAQLQAKKEAEKQAITKALQYVVAIHSGVEHPADLGEIFFGVSKERKVAYVQSLKRTPLEGCPEDFREAFQRHVAAWKEGDGDEDALKTTASDLWTIARMHGVQ